MGGTVGLNPTRGLVSTNGVYPLSWTLDHVGPIAKTVADTAALLEIIVGYDENDPVSASSPDHNFTNKLTTNIKDIVIGIEEDFFFNNIDSRIEQLIKDQIKVLENQGAQIKKVKVPPLLEGETVGFHLSLSEASMVHYHNILTRLRRL